VDKTSPLLAFMTDATNRPSVFLPPTVGRVSLFAGCWFVGLLVHDARCVLSKSAIFMKFSTDSNCSFSVANFVPITALRCYYYGTNVDYAY